jgi:HSP20 family molecular chaperone IbpA
MTRLTFAGNPLLLGFDGLEQLLDRLSKTQADGYPPYNIERRPSDATGGERLRITLAVAGFTREQLEVTLENRQLAIRGKQSEDNGRAFLHRGIATRQFQRVFVLADGIDVVAAELDNGLLSIDLVKPEPEKKVKKIQIAQK